VELGPSCPATQQVCDFHYIFLFLLTSSTDNMMRRKPSSSTFSTKVSHTVHMLQNMGRDLVSVSSMPYHMPSTKPPSLVWFRARHLFFTLPHHIPHPTTCQTQNDMPIGIVLWSVSFLLLTTCRAQNHTLIGVVSCSASFLCLKHTLIGVNSLSNPFLAPRMDFERCLIFYIILNYYYIIQFNI